MYGSLRGPPLNRSVLPYLRHLSFKGRIKISTYILMKILESAPDRYDAGIRILTLGSVDRTYDRLLSHVKRKQRVLDIGCGTGALTLRAAQKGAEVKGIDINSQLLEIANKRVKEANLEKNVELCEIGVAELADEEAESYEVVMSGLCFSELTEDELIYSLKEVERILKPGGVLLIADEVMPQSIPKRIIHRLIRFPLVIITYLLTQTTTHSVRNLPEEVGLLIESVRLSKIENFIELVARKANKGIK
jgi:ubiquinone/menaquinone biosynthesis C-methylase UbiE